VDRAYISWNVPNLISVILMAALGWFVLGLVVQGSKKYVGNSSSSAQADVDEAVLNNG
jgi:hypothetical protein